MPYPLNRYSPSLIWTVVSALELPSTCLPPMKSAFGKKLLVFGMQRDEVAKIIRRQLELKE